MRQDETDRELLEFAAKAAGLRVGFEPDGKYRGRHDLYWSINHHQLVWHGKSTGSEYPRPIFWNTITDDGDAFRLMVKCGFFSYEIIPEELSSAFLQSDPYAATRRAITRAAAEIGRNMK